MTKKKAAAAVRRAAAAVKVKAAGKAPDSKAAATRKAATKPAAGGAAKRASAAKVAVGSASSVRPARASRKPVVSKQTAPKHAAPKHASGRTVAVVKSAGRPVAQKKPGGARTKKLGRARVTADAQLDQLFLKDYEARQVFEFLHVATIRELEQFTPEEIITRLTGPMVQTVNRIRKALALNNRCLRDDEDFAVGFLAAIAPSGTVRRKPRQPDR